MNHNTNQGVVKIFYRRLYFCGFPFSHKIHPIIKDWNNTYYEYLNNKGIIKIQIGKLKTLNKLSKNFFNKKPKPKETIKVNKKKFLESVNTFKLNHQGKNYNPFNFSTNSIGFKNFVLKKSKIAPTEI